MKAVVQDTDGSADVLEVREIAKPAPTDDEVLVRVHAAGVDPGVWHLMTGLPYLVRVMGYGLRTPKVGVRGRDVAGRVALVGKNVTQVQPGAEVFGIGEGSFAVQLAKAFGARVTGVCSTTRMELVGSIGADEVIDYTREDVADGCATGTSSWTPRAAVRVAAARALTRRGTLAIAGGEGGGRWLGGVDRQILRALIEAGKITPVIDRTYPLREVPEAIRYPGQDTLAGRSSSPCEPPTTPRERSRPNASFPPDAGYPSCLSTALVHPGMSGL